MNNNKHQRIAVTVAVVAASLFSLGAIAVPTPAFAGDDEVKQKANAEAKCKQNFEVEEGNANPNEQTMGACIAAAININELIVVGGGSPFAASNSEVSPGEFSGPSTP